MNIKYSIRNNLDKTILGHWAKFIVDIDPLPQDQVIDSPFKLINHYFVNKGFSSIGRKWQEISFRDADACISYCIKNSIVYPKQLTDQQLANEMAQDFVAEFSQGRYFTNLRPQSWRPFILGANWTSVGCEDYMDPLGWQFEHGISIIAFDDHQIGIFCKLECD